MKKVLLRDITDAERAYSNALINYGENNQETIRKLGKWQDLKRAYRGQKGVKSNMPKTIHLKCGHKIKVRTWPSSAGLAKVRHHYKKFHPAMMKKMTKKSLATKRKRGLINPVGQKWIILWKDGVRKGSVGLTKKNLEELKRQFYLQLIQTDMAGHKHYNIFGVKKEERKRGLIKNRCNPKRRLPKRHAPLRMLKQYERDYLEKTLGRSWGLMPKPTIMRVLKKLKSLKPNPQPVIIYDKLLGIEARKSHGKFAGENFKHDFKSKTDAIVLGNPDGSLTIRSKKGKRLWKNFEY